MLVNEHKSVLNMLNTTLFITIYGPYNMGKKEEFEDFKIVRSRNKGLTENELYILFHRLLDDQPKPYSHIHLTH